MLENQLSNCNMDVIDFDSGTSNSYAIDNMGIDTCATAFSSSSPTPTFVYGNFTTTRDITNPPGHGVGVYNGNSLFSNISDIINNGLRVGSISTASGGVAESAHTFMFNNIAKNSTGDGILF